MGANDKEYATVSGLLAGARQKETAVRKDLDKEEHAVLEASVQRLESQVKTLNQDIAVARKALQDIGLRWVRRDKLERDRIEAEKRRDVASRLANMLRGKGGVRETRPYLVFVSDYEVHPCVPQPAVLCS